jgi:hypothetical protein
MDLERDGSHDLIRRHGQEGADARQRIMPSGRWLLLFALALGGCALPSARDAELDRSLREEIHTVAEAHATTVVTSFRPRGDGPFPWIVLSHGTATTPEANRALGRYRPLAPVREWVRRGYAVVLPFDSTH